MLIVRKKVNITGRSANFFRDMGKPAFAKRIQKVRLEERDK